MACEREAKKECEIGFQHVRSPQVSEKQGVALQESNDRVDE